MKREIRLVWTDGTPETYMVPQLEVHLGDGIETEEQIDHILRMAARFGETRIRIPRVHVRTKEYDTEQAALETAKKEKVA